MYTDYLEEEREIFKGNSPPRQARAFTCPRRAQRSLLRPLKHSALYDLHLWPLHDVLTALDGQGTEQGTANLHPSNVSLGRPASAWTSRGSIWWQEPFLLLTPSYPIHCKTHNSKSRVVKYTAWVIKQATD